MTIIDVELRKTSDVAKVFGAMALTFITVPLIYLLVVRGPLWPVARVMYLRQKDDILRHDGVINPPFERWVAWFALFCVTVAMSAAAVALKYPLSDAWIVTALFGIVYGYLTYFVFEWHLLDALKALWAYSAIVLLSICFGFILMFTPDKHHEEIE